MGEIAREAGCKVLVDEVYREAVFDNTPRSAFHLGPEFVVTSSLTKVYGLSGLRCGWILAEPELARALWRLNDLFGVNAPHAVERLAVIALQDLGAIRERARRLLTANRPLLRGFLESREDLEVVRAPWGTTVFPRLRARLGRGPGRPPPQRVRDVDRPRAVLRRRAALPDRHRRRDLDGSRRAPAPGAGPGRSTSWNPAATTNVAAFKALAARPHWRAMRRPWRSMKKKHVVLIVVAILAVAGGAFAYSKRGPKPTEVEVGDGRPRGPPGQGHRQRQGPGHEEGGHLGHHPRPDHACSR